MTAFLVSVKDFAINSAWAILWSGLLLTVMELTFPATRYSLSSRIRGYAFWVVNILITAVALRAFSVAFGALGLHPLWTFRPFANIDGFLHGAALWAPIGFVELTVAAFLGNIVFFFFYYWFHRAQHALPWLWKFHEVHHSVTEMSAINCNHHFTEEIFRIPFITIPTSLIIGIDSGATPFLVAAFLSLQTLYEHSCTRLRMPFIKYLINDNSYHRIHHSIEEHHWNKNFCSFTPIWDIVFRTAYFPTRDEWPDTGVPGVREPLSVREMLFMPFRLTRPESEEASVHTPLDAKRA